MPSLGATGARLRDISRRKNNGTLTSFASPSAAWGAHAGRFGITFDGDNDCVDLGTIGTTHPLCLAGSDGTLTAWFYQHSGGDNYQRVFDKSDGVGAQNGYALWLLPNATGPYSPCAVGLQVNGNNYTEYAGGHYTLNTWHHVAGVITAADYALYIDGRELTGCSFVTNAAQQPPPVQTNAMIGTWNHATAREFDGLLGEVMVFATALTPGQIAWLYQDSRAQRYAWLNRRRWAVKATIGGGVAPTGVLYGSLVGPFGGAI